MFFVWVEADFKSNWLGFHQNCARDNFGHTAMK